MGHAIEPSTTVAYAHRYHLRQKKDVVYGLLFSLHASADLRFKNPIETPNKKLPKFVLNKIPIKNTCNETFQETDCYLNTTPRTTRIFKNIFQLGYGNLQTVYD